jgi:PAS domain-containing protein
VTDRQELPSESWNSFSKGGSAAMSQKEIEVILTRQLASYLAMPVFLVDPEGILLFFNEPAEAILGLRFDETGEMRVHELATLFRATDKAGNPLPPEQLPLTVALAQHRPAYQSFWIRGMDDVRRYIEEIAFPVIGQANRFLGAVAIFIEGRE